MNQWVTTVVVAGIAAMATIVAANITSANTRRNVRGRILQDLEIAEKLPDDSRAKQIITNYAENRALLLPLENHIRYVGMQQIQSLGILVVALALLVVSKGVMTRYLHLGWAVLLWFVIIFRYWYNFARDRTNLVNQYILEQDLPSTVVERVQGLYFRSYRRGWLFQFVLNMIAWVRNQIGHVWKFVVSRGKACWHWIKWLSCNK